MNFQIKFLQYHKYNRERGSEVVKFLSSIHERLGRQGNVEVVSVSKRKMLVIFNIFSALCLKRNYNTNNSNAIKYRDSLYIIQQTKPQVWHRTWIKPNHHVHHPPSFNHIITEAHFETQYKRSSITEPECIMCVSSQSCPNLYSLTIQGSRDYIQQQWHHSEHPPMNQVIGDSLPMKEGSAHTKQEKFRLWNKHAMQENKPWCQVTLLAQESRKDDLPDL